LFTFGKERLFHIPDLASSEFYKALLFTFCSESGLPGRPASADLDPVPDFFMFCPDFLCIPMHSRVQQEGPPSKRVIDYIYCTMDADSQNRGHCSGCIAGVPNYQNDILIDIVEKELPLGHEAWRAVAFAYQNASNEENLW
jgi:hypothetical protein